MNGKNDTVLLCSHRKTGQHWILFFIANYYRIIEYDIQRTEGFETVPEYAQFKSNELKKHSYDQDYMEGFPRMRWMEYSRTYSSWINKLFNGFDKTIYLYRNPHDVMISFFHYFVRTEKGQQWLKTMDLKNSFYFQDFIEYNLPRYIKHIEVSLPYCDVVLCYDELRRNVNPFRKIVKLFFNEVDENAFKKAIEFSSAENIRKIEEEAKKDWEPIKKIWHVRDGRSGQYKEKMNKEIINYINKEWNKLKERLKKRRVKIW